MKTKKRAATRIKEKTTNPTSVKAVRVRNGQKLARINPETNSIEKIYEDYEMEDLMRKPNMLLLNEKSMINRKGDGVSFHKSFKNSWAFLRRELTALEINAVISMVVLSSANNCSLEPLNDSTTIGEIANHLHISISKTKSVLKTLYEYGVYGKFEISIPDKPYTKYWILNPFLSFNGTVIDTIIFKLFKETHVGKSFKNPNYVFKPTKYNEYLR